MGPQQDGGSTPNSFDFVQNTGVFTMSTFVNIGDATGGYMTIFDTSEGSISTPRLQPVLQQNRTVVLERHRRNGETVRFHFSAPDVAAMTPSTWYHVAVVGTGPGNPVKFYITPVSSSTVSSYASTTALAGANGTYPSDINHELFIGSRSNKQSPGTSPFNGGMVNQTIFDTALTQTQIQQMFLFGKGLTAAGSAWQNPTDANDINGNGKVQPGDVAILVGRLLKGQGGTLPDPGPGNEPPPWLDPSGNNILNAGDVVKVIGWILTHPPAADPLTVQQADSESESAEPMAEALAQAASGETLAENVADADAPAAESTPNRSTSIQSTSFQPTVAATVSVEDSSVPFSLFNTSTVESSFDASAAGAGTISVGDLSAAAASARRGLGVTDRAALFVEVREPADRARGSLLRGRIARRIADSFFGDLAFGDVTRFDEEADEFAGDADSLVTAPWVHRTARRWRARA